MPERGVINKELAVSRLEKNFPTRAVFLFRPPTGSNSEVVDRDPGRRRRDRPKGKGENHLYSICVLERDLADSETA